MTETVHVTAEDIAQGKRGSCRLCPIAQTLIRLGHRDVLVGAYGGSVADQKSPLGRRWFYLDEVGQDFIRKFDAYPVPPGPAEVVLKWS